VAAVGQSVNGGSADGLPLRLAPNLSPSSRWRKDGAQACSLRILGAFFKNESVRTVIPIPQSRERNPALIPSFIGLLQSLGLWLMQGQARDFAPASSPRAGVDTMAEVSPKFPANRVTPNEVGRSKSGSKNGGSHPTGNKMRKVLAP